MMSFWFAIGLATCLSAPTTQPVALDLRGEPAGAALAELAGRLDVPYILDASVERSALEVPVRLFARHLSGEQALRHLARWVGLEAVWVDGAVLVAVPDRLPAVWRSTSSQGGPAPGRNDKTRRSDALARRAAVSWVDAPLSLVARDVSQQFEVDVIFDRTIHAEQPLLELVGPDASLRDVLMAWADQLEATISYVDGALWVRRDLGEAGSQPAGAAGGGRWPEGGFDPSPACPDQASVRSEQAAAEPPRASAAVVIGPEVGSWVELAHRLGEACGLASQVEVPSQTGYPPIEANGPVRYILAALRLAGHLHHWQIEPDGGSAGGTLRLRVQAQTAP